MGRESNAKGKRTTVEKEKSNWNITKKTIIPIMIITQRLDEGIFATRERG
jgi:hypothetical protein